VPDLQDGVRPGPLRGSTVILKMAVAMVMQAGERQLHFRLYQAVQHAALGSTANQLHRTSHYRFVSRQTVSG
jgi:hypothetical protein